LSNSVLGTVTVTVTGSQVVGTTTLTATPTTGPAPLTVSFNASGPVGTSITNTINFGDGSTGTLNPAPVCADCGPSSSASHTYTAPGTYTVTVSYISACPTQVSCPQVQGTMSVKVTVQAAQATTFRILVDTNQLDADPASPNESTQASRFAGDGAWILEPNSPASVDWTKTLSDLNADTWAISEDAATVNGATWNQTVDMDESSQYMGRLVDAAMVYNEDGLATPLTDDQINYYANVQVGKFGPLGPRIVVMTRSYADGDARQAQLNHALQNPNVSGAAFEINSDAFGLPESKIDVGCRYALSLGKKCYFLLTAGNGLGQPQDVTHPMPTTADYLGDLYQFLVYMAESGGILNNPNTYIVIATYVRPNTMHYLDQKTNDPDSVENIVRWLKAYRMNMPSVKPLPGDTHQMPTGWLAPADCSQVGGWDQDLDTPDYPLLTHFYIDGTFVGYTYANTYRGDLCNAIGSCFHGYIWQIPAQYRDGKQHTLNAYGVDSTLITSNRGELQGSPKTFQCSQ
jgi:PKD domain